jgi:predicted metalloendopeptidase
MTRHSIQAFAAAALLCTLLSAQALAQAQPRPLACTDFDEYVNGQWNASNELAANRSRIGSFMTLRFDADRLIADGVAELLAKPELQKTPGLRLLATYYGNGLDEAAIEKQGLNAVQPWLARLASVTREGLPALMGDLARLQLQAPMGMFIGTDAKDATRHVLSLQQADLGLPDRDDYTRSDEHATRLQTAYRRYAGQLLAASGAAADSTTVDALLAFEAQLAAAALARAERRDPVAQYNPMDAATLQATAPGMDWSAYLAAYTGQPDRVAQLPLVLAQPRFAKAVAQLAQTAPLDTWRSYLRVRLLDRLADLGPKALARASFDYNQAAVRGLKAPLPRHEEVAFIISGRTGGEPLAETLGELFVGKTFSPLAQQRAQAMVEDIRAAMKLRIQALDWMSPATKLQAVQKLDALVPKIGGPARWKTYEGLMLKPGDFMGNLLALNAWNTAQRLADLGKPVDRKRWFSSPHIVNAFAGGGNQITFPAAILQPPFFDPKADDASNYGAIGMVIGHEITHHFDDRGRQFDRVGNLKDWWTEADAAAYKLRAERVAKLYGSFEPVPGVPINGRLTLGENISDLGGLQIAYDALQIALKRQRESRQPAPLVEGQTPEQRFFTANAVIWRGKQRIESLVDQLRTDGHSPGRWRVLAPMAQMPAFAQAFSCQAGDAMVAADPVRVW